MGEFTNGKMEQYVHDGSTERPCSVFVSIEELNRGEFNLIDKRAFEMDKFRNKPMDITNYHESSKVGS